MTRSPNARIEPNPVNVESGRSWWSPAAWQHPLAARSWHPADVEIRDAAAGFCQIIESAEQYSRDNSVVDVVSALSAAVAAAAAMPPIELPEGPLEDDYEPPEIPHAVWRERFMAVGHALADWDIYWTVDPLSEND